MGGSYTCGFRHPQWAGKVGPAWSSLGPPPHMVLHTSAETSPGGEQCEFTSPEAEKPLQLDSPNWTTKLGLLYPIEWMLLLVGLSWKS